MPGRSVRIARIAGIPVGISPWWLVIVALITWSLGESYYPDEIPGIAPAAAYALGLLSVLLLFASILAHEFGHAIVARRRGMEIEGIDLWLLGGVSRMSGHPRGPEDELRFALAGPIVTAVVAAVFGVLAFAVRGTGTSALRVLVDYQFQTNLLILVFNLLPALPLDGGRVARAVLWHRSGNLARATEIAAGIGRGFGYVLVGLGILLTAAGWVLGLWLVLIGVFLVAGASAERMQEEVVAAFTGVPVSDLMSAPAISIPADISLDDSRSYFARYRYHAFPVVDRAGRALGLLTIEQLERTPLSERHRVAAGERADRDPRLLVAADTDVARLLEVAAFARAGSAVVVDGDGRPIGIVSRTDLQRAIRASRLGDRRASGL